MATTTPAEFMDPYTLLPTELWVAVGDRIPDVQSIVHFSHTCRAFRPLLMRLLTGDARKIQEVIQRCIKTSPSNFQELKDQFLAECAKSPHRNSAMTLFCDAEFKDSIMEMIRPVLPNAECIRLPAPVPRIVAIDFAQYHNPIPLWRDQLGGAPVFFRHERHHVGSRRGREQPF